MTIQIPEEELEVARNLFNDVVTDSFGAIELITNNDEGEHCYIVIYPDGVVHVGDQVAINNKQFECIVRIRKIVTDRQLP